MLTPIVALVFIFLGIVISFFGYGLFRILLPIVGAISGYAIGSEIISNFTNDMWLMVLVSLIAAAIGAVLAALVWQLAVVLQVAYIAYVFSLSILPELHIVGPNVVPLVALVVAGVVAMLALVFRLWKLLVILSTAINGAYLGVAGVIMLLGSSANVSFSWRTDFLLNLESSVNRGAVLLGICVWAAAGIYYQVQRYREIDAD